MCDIFETRNFNNNLRSQTDFIRTCVSASSSRLNSLKYLATKIWDVVPYDIASVENLNSFKKNITIVCSYHVTYVFQSEPKLYSCLNVKELLARSRRHI